MSTQPLTKAEREELRKIASDFAACETHIEDVLPGAGMLTTPAATALRALPRLLADLDAAEARMEFSDRWYATRWERLRMLLPAGSTIEKEACDIMANGHLLMDLRPSDPLTLAVARAENAEAQRDRAESELDAERKLRVEAEAAVKRAEEERDALKAQEGEWADQIAAALNSTADKLGRTPSMIAGHVRREHEAHTACFDRLRKAVDERDALKAKLANSECAASLALGHALSIDQSAIDDVIRQFVALKAKLARGGAQ